ncbi:MAG: asparagine synthase (glutamine-hydrolyzing), partial [Candidatus Babeliales bacterium]
MCGFAGYMNLSQQGFKVDKELLSRMHQALAHRGPDGDAIWVNQEHEIGLAFRRLSIIDLSDTAMQPMMDKEATVIICFNGEIYNHHELRKMLIDKGCVFVTQSDTEVILHAYKIWGIDCLHRLDGMFAISLYDLQARRLYVIRDRIGVKPLYFSLQSGIISFASEIKALWQLPWMSKEFSDIAMYHYLTFMVSPAPYTIFEGVYKLPAGFYACVDASKKISFVEWYSPVVPCLQQEKKEYHNEVVCVDAIRTALVAAIEKRMGSDVPFGAFLSGGLDSSLNVALMSRFSSPVKTFTIAFNDGADNELDWARLIAEQFTTDHHEMILTEQEAFQLYEKMVYHLDEPLAD